MLKERCNYIIEDMLEITPLSCREAIQKIKNFHPNEYILKLLEEERKNNPNNLEIIHKIIKYERKRV